MSESQSPVSQHNVAETNNQTQQKQLEIQSSFTELKDSINLQAQGKDLKQEQGTNRPGLTSRDELISITGTINGVSFRSTDTIFTEEERDTQKNENNNEGKEAQKKSESSSGKESLQCENSEQAGQPTHARMDDVSLTQTTPYHILHQSNIECIQSTSQSSQLHNTNMDDLFTQVHTEQITIDHSTAKNIQSHHKQTNISQQCPMVSPPKPFDSGQSITQTKFKIVKTLQIRHVPNSQPKADITTNDNTTLPQQEVKQENKTAPQPIKEQIAPKPEPQPFKLESLYVSSLRTGSVIKPPQSNADKKPKIWQMFKSKRQNRQANPAQSPNQPYAPNKKSQIPQQNKTTISIDSSPIKLQSIPNAQLPVLPQKIQSILQPKAAPQQPKIQKQMVQPQIKPQAQMIHKPLFMDRKPLFEDDKQLQQDHRAKSDVIQFHHTDHHPLERTIEHPTTVDPMPNQQQQQQIKPAPAGDAEGNPQQQNQQQNKPPQQTSNQIEQNEQAYADEQQSEASPSQKQQMIVDYTHNKKYQEELQRLDRQRKIKELQLRLKNQEQINRQLQKSLSLPIKFLASAAVGATTAGVAWIAKKNKNISILLGVATTVATFVFSY